MTDGLRRLAVVRDGQFVGMITVDDLVVDLASGLVDLSRPISTEIHHAAATAPFRPRREPTRRRPVA